MAAAAVHKSDESSAATAAAVSSGGGGGSSAYDDYELELDCPGHCRITNVMGLVDLGTKVDLKYLATHMWNVEYQPTKNAALQLQLRDPRCKVNIYASGKMTSIGTRSPRECERAMRRAAKMIRAVGWQTDGSESAEEVESKKQLRAPRATSIVFRDFAITNLGGAADYGRRVRVEAFASVHDDICTYEPEISRAVEIGMTDPVECSIRLFTSGKMLIPKVRSADDCKRAMTKLWELLEGFAMPDDADSGIAPPKQRKPRAGRGKTKKRRAAAAAADDEDGVGFDSEDDAEGEADDDDRAFVASDNDEA